MFNLIEKRNIIDWLKWGEGFLIAVIISLLAWTLYQPEPKVVQVPVIKVVEKKVIVKQPVYMSKYDRQQVQCLADNAYFEAGNQSQRGKIAVTNVVMNRVKDPRFPKTPCGVVYQKARGVCQFSWVCEGKKRIRNANVYIRAKKAAIDVYYRKVGDVTYGAKFYHADYVNPRWNLQRIAVIGDHIFYNYYQG